MIFPGILKLSILCRDRGLLNFALTAVRQSSKALFLFDVWKISAAGMITDDYPVVVPAGAKAAVDGVELTESIKPRIRRKGRIRIGFLFLTASTLSRQRCRGAVYEGEFDTSSDSSAAVTELTLSENGEKALQAKMEEALEKFYTSAVSGEDYSEVSGLFTGSAAPEYKAVYDDLKEKSRQ